MATGLLAINHEILLSKLLNEPIFRQCAQSTKCFFDEVSFRRNGSLDEVSFDEVSHFGKIKILKDSLQFNFLTGRCKIGSRTHRARPNRYGRHV